MISPRGILICRFKFPKKAISNKRFATSKYISHVLMLFSITSSILSGLSKSYCTTGVKSTPACIPASFNFLMASNLFVGEGANGSKAAITLQYLSC